MKKFVAVVLTIVCVMSLVVPAFAVDAQNNTAWTFDAVSVAGIEGKVIYQDTADNVGIAAISGESGAETIMSYTENADGTYTIFQYMNGSLLEEHTTAPGSGIVERKIYSTDGSFTKITEITCEVSELSDVSTNVVPRSSGHTCSQSQLASNSAKYNLGYMHYIHSFTNTIYSINCDVISEQHLGQEYTFGAGTAKTLSNWTSTLLSIFPIFKNPAVMVAKFIAFAQDKGILSAVIEGLITAMVTKTMVCDFYNQEIHGTATSHSGYPHVILDGTYAFVTMNGETRIETEGYTVRQWGNASMGRWMMYKVFGIDEAPTSWSNLDN